MRVKCIDEGTNNCITEGKEYEVIQSIPPTTSFNAMYSIKCDDGEERNCFQYRFTVVGMSTTPKRIKCVRTLLPNESTDWGPVSKKNGKHVLTVGDVYEVTEVGGDWCKFKGAHHFGGPDHETMMDRRFFEVVPDNTPLHNKHWNNGKPKFVGTPSNPLPPEPPSDPYTEHRLKLTKQGIETHVHSPVGSMRPDNSVTILDTDLVADDTGPTKYD